MSFRLILLGDKMLCLHAVVLRTCDI